MRAVSLFNNNTMETTAEQIVQKLAEWSKKYPRGKVYHISKQSMDDELIAIEKEAVEYAGLRLKDISCENKKTTDIIINWIEKNIDAIHPSYPEKGIMYFNRPFLESYLGGLIPDIRKSLRLKESNKKVYKKLVLGDLNTGDKFKFIDEEVFIPYEVIEKKGYTVFCFTPSGNRQYYNIGTLVELWQPEHPTNH